MKNKLLAALALVLLLSVLVSCGEDSEKAPDETKAEEIKNGMVYEYSSANPDLVLSGTYYDNNKEVYRNDYDYWEDGKLKTITTYEDDEKTETWSYLYSREGVLIQMVREFCEDGSEMRDDYRYSDKGKLCEISWYTDEEYDGGYLYTYNEEGELSLEQNLDANRDVIMYTAYSFDADGKARGYDKYMYGSVVEYGKYEYNEDGLLGCINKYTGSNELYGSVRNEYDSEGNVIKMLTSDEKGTVLSYTECLYDENGFNYRDIYYEDGKPVYRYDYTKEGARIYTAYN